MIEIGNWLADTNDSPTNEPCGLFVANDAKTPVPLRSRVVKASIFAEHGFCEITEELNYVSTEDCTVRFIFPLPPRSAVFK